MKPTDFANIEFDVVSVNEIGDIIDRQRRQAFAFRENVGRTTFELIAIPGGAFTMGSPSNEEGRDHFSHEGPQHDVVVPSFLMGKYPVTQAQWRAVAALPKIKRELNPDPSQFEGDNRPVERVTWIDTMEFCARVSQQTGREYRLPSEAEWEYACRAVTTTPFHFGPTITADLANYRGDTEVSEDGTVVETGTYGAGPVGIYREQTTDIVTFPANDFGLYGMHGNVLEWCLDKWHDNYKGAPTDGSAWLEQGHLLMRVLRGGSWNNRPARCRSASRFGYVGGQRLALLDNYATWNQSSQIIGFRIVCATLFETA